LDICVFIREKCTNFALTSTEETYLGDNIHSKSMKSIFLSRPLGVLVFLFVCIEKGGKIEYDERVSIPK